MKFVVARVQARPNQTTLSVWRGRHCLLEAELPPPKELEHLAALAAVLEALGEWLEAPLAVALHVSAQAIGWWDGLDDPCGLPLSGTCYECTVFVEDSPETTKAGGAL